MGFQSPWIDLDNYLALKLRLEIILFFYKVPLRVKKHKRPSYLPMNMEESNVFYFHHVVGYWQISKDSKICEWGYWEWLLTW
jgi:predicted membrane-bound mannosyltransferase